MITRKVKPDGNIEISLDGVIIGSVFKSSHDVWVADPLTNMFSCSFLTQSQAEDELVMFYRDQKTVFGS